MQSTPSSDKSSSQQKGRAILPPIKYDKPYDNIFILEVKDVYQIKEWCNLTSVLALRGQRASMKWLHAT